MMLGPAVHRALHSVIFKEWPSESHFFQTAQHVWKKEWSYTGCQGKVTNMLSSMWRVKKPLSSRYSLFFLTPPHNALPPSRQTDKDKCRSQVSLLRRGPKAAGSYFSFSLVWWCDFVFFRNRFISNGSVYLSAPSPILYSLLCRSKDGGLWAAVSNYLQSADFTAVLFFF